MSNIVDNLIAYRILSMLIKPFTETDAYKLGIIDKNGNNLVKSKDFTTSEQKNAYNYLTRLVFNLKKILNKLPGGESQTKNIVAAFFLLKEAYKTHSVNIDEQYFERLINMLEEGVVLVEEQLLVEEFINVFLEDGGAATAPANVTGHDVSTDEPVIRRHPRRFARFVVNDQLYNKFSEGKAKFRKWASYLNLENEGEKQIYEFAKKNPYSVIILHNGKNTKVIGFHRNRRNENPKLQRPTKQVNNEVV